MIDSARPDSVDRPDRLTLARMSLPAPKRGESAIVPRHTIAGRALTAVVAIMTFLAALTTGAVILVVGAAAEWQSDVSREMTIQIRPATNRDIEADVQKAADVARAAAGVAEVRPYTKEESTRLLEPWIGTGLSLDNLPVPRLIIVRLVPGQRPDVAALRRALEAQVAGAILDDHRGWVDRMHVMANTAVAAGLAILALVIAATVLSVTFATLGAMATNRTVIEVLHFIGAKDRYIARQFQRHFLVLGLKGGAIGGGAALVLFGLVSFLGDWLAGTAAGGQAGALFGTFSIGFLGYAALLVLIVIIAVITAATSHRVVHHMLRSVT
jgi:cell division transport system permease protein